MIYGLVQYRNLSDSVQKLRYEKISLEKEVSATKFEKDYISTNLILITNSNAGLIQNLNRTSIILDGNCHPDYKIRCKKWLEYNKILGFLNKSITRRIQSRSESDFIEVFKLYSSLEKMVEGVSWTREIDSKRWMAISAEGMAYSLYRQDKMNDAKTKIDFAKILYPDSGIVNSTYLKIYCAIGEKTVSKVEFYKLEKMLSKQIELHDDRDSKLNAKFNKTLFLSDPELRKECKF